MPDSRQRPRFLVVIGTRPEAIKLAPVVRALRGRKQDVRVCITGQHREMLRPHLKALGIKPDFRLSALRTEQDLSALAARMLAQIDGVIVRSRADWVIVQGDSTSAFAGALAAYHRQVKVAHVEAGLRTYDLSAPFPEELNRRAIALIASVHFAPTESARANLLREQVPAETITVTGNTVIDSLQWALAKPAPRPARNARPSVIVSAHRRENLSGLDQVISAIDALAQRHPQSEFLFLRHRNPAVTRALKKLRHARATGPLAYPEFARLLAACAFVITDSGGLQEEATALGKPLLVLREATERVEAITSRGAELVPLESAAIVRAAERLLNDPAHLARRSLPSPVFGDGRAAERIAEALLKMQAPG